MAADQGDIMPGRAARMIRPAGLGIGSSSACAVFTAMLPLVVALLDASVLCTTTLILVGLLWKWWDSSLHKFVTMSRAKYRKWPELELETISLSHYGEKVRWCLDKLGVEYAERPVAGVVGIFFLGRSVPVLRVTHNPMSKSTIGNSPDILRFLHGMYQNSPGINAEFLAETAESRELEQSLDVYGRMVQAWMYSYCLDEKEMVLHAWGANDPKLPQWQRSLVRVCYPALVAMMKNAFRLQPREEARERSLKKIREILGECEARLGRAVGTAPFLLGTRLSYVDITLAALSGVWLLTVDQDVAKGFGAGAYDGVRVPESGYPPVILQDCLALRDAHPKVTELVARLYREERQPVEC